MVISLLSTPGGIPIPSFLEGVFQRMGRPPQSPGEHQRDSRGGERHRAVHQQPRLPWLREQPQAAVGLAECANEQDPSQGRRVSDPSMALYRAKYRFSPLLSASPWRPIMGAGQTTSGYTGPRHPFLWTGVTGRPTTPRACARGGESRVWGAIQR